MSRTTEPNELADVAASPKAAGWAWGLCWLMFASTVLNYMDRQSIALVNPQIRREFGVDFEGFGWVLAAFGLTYALFQVPAGFLVDRFRVRRVYAFAVSLWSLAAIATAFSPVLGALIAMRALLGVGESFNWPAALKVTGMILPPRDRSLGNGIFNAGAAAGAVLTPPTVALLAAWAGWRMTFAMIGSLGFVWVAVWLFATRNRLPSVVERTIGEPLEVGVGTDPPRRGLSRRGRLAFGAVGILALLIILVGLLMPASVPVTSESLHVSQSGTLAARAVEVGDKVKQGARLAEIRMGDDRFTLLAPADGEVAEWNVSPGGTTEPSVPVLTLQDPAGRFGVAPNVLRPESPVRVVAWSVAPSEPVAEGAEIAAVAAGSATARIVADRGGIMARFEVSEGSRVAPDAPLAVLQVRGFDQMANGLPGIWFGIALLMFGSLAVARGVPLAELGESGWARRLGEVVRYRRFWVLVLVTCSINVCWHFLVSWLPTYLQTDRRMTYLAGGLFSTLPFIAADVGNLLGGAASRGLAGRGVETTRARLVVMTVSALLISCGAIIGRIPVGSGDALVLTLLGLMALGAAAFMANYFAFCQEVAPSHTGLIVGYLGGLGNLLAAGFYPVVGRIKDQTGDFRLVFLIVGLLPLVGLAALALGWRSRLEPPETA